MEGKMTGEDSSLVVRLARLRWCLPELWLFCFVFKERANSLEYWWHWQCHHWGDKDAAPRCPLNSFKSSPNLLGTLSQISPGIMTLTLERISAPVSRAGILLTMLWNLYFILFYFETESHYITLVELCFSYSFYCHDKTPQPKQVIKENI